MRNVSMIYHKTEHGTIYCGDSLEVLKGMADESVDCCITSPPYWGLRDYGTAEWEGGDAECNYSMIRFSAIDKETRSLVESLLKAQKEVQE